MYWKRASYFWTLIAAAFAGYFAIISKDEAGKGQVEKYLLAFIVACIGLIFTHAWFLVNRGSKRWQENWENHIELLEDDVTRPLYKTVLNRPKETRFIEKHITSPEKFSVSKINTFVSLFTFLIWILLILYASNINLKFNDISIFKIISLLITLIFMWLLGDEAKSHNGSHNPEVWIRETKIQEESD